MITLSFKDQNVFRNSLDIEWHPLLVDLVYWIYTAGLVSSMVVTSGFRKGDSGVHGCNPLRGLDLRSRELENPKLVVDTINSHWQYDSSRPEKTCAMLHNTGSGMHIHLQVHPETIIIKGGW